MEKYRSGRLSAYASLILLGVALGVACAPGVAVAEQQDGFTSSITSEQIVANTQQPQGESSGLATQSLTAQATITVDESAITALSGADRYETSAMEALLGWPNGCKNAILATGTSWADALAGSGLAGAFGCPIILTAPDGLAPCTSNALQQLGVQNLVILGGTNAVSEQVERDAAALGIEKMERLAGTDRFDTQLKIYERGSKRWAHSYALVVRGTGDSGFADALSVAPVAFAAKAPVFVTDTQASLNQQQREVLSDGVASGLFEHVIVVGGEVCVCAETEEFLQGLSSGSDESNPFVTRFAGQNRYDTSALVARWAMQNQILAADNAAFASGLVPWDALGGGVLQGRSKSVLLLVDAGQINYATRALLDNGGVTNVRFLGGTSAISDRTRSSILAMLGLGCVFYTDYPVTLDEFRVSQEATPYSGSLDYCDPTLYSIEDREFFQFAVLSSGYSGKVSAAQIDAYIDQMCVWQEKLAGCRSSLRGTGAYFIEAASMYNINEVYLLLHAAVETGWGCSQLAQGGAGVDGDYYNFFGIKAYNGSAVTSGTSYAEEKGWDTPEKAILGGAEFISLNYINAPEYQQDTLYLMRWNPEYYAVNRVNYHQYAGATIWPEYISRSMASFYDYAGIALEDTGLAYNVPRYLQAEAL